MSKHTPGPWTVEWPLADSIDDLPSILAHDGKTLVATIHQPLTDENGDYRGTFDARLIAAAPDLLEALQCLLPGLILDLRYADADDDQEAMRHRISSVANAIAKAEGIAS